MEPGTKNGSSERFARCIAASKRVCWDIDADVIRGRTFKPLEKLLPNGLSLIHQLTFLTSDEARFLSQVQGRTYANVFGLVERFICAKMLEISRHHWFGDQVALEALIRFCDEELKHQRLFRRLEKLAADVMPEGYRFLADPDAVAAEVMTKGTWAVLALTLHIELFTQRHYRESIAWDEQLSPLFKDVFLFHWKEESQHSIVDELEWTRLDAELTEAERDRGVDELLELITAVHGTVQAQAAEDVRYFTDTVGRSFDERALTQLHDTVLRAYRWQYVISGVEHPRFQRILGQLVDETQVGRLAFALEAMQLTSRANNLQTTA